MLDRENFCRRHKGGLAAVGDGDHRGLQRDDGLAAADVALEQAIIGAAFPGRRRFHRGRAFFAPRSA